jgi:hypothetical protein
MAREEQPVMAGRRTRAAAPWAAGSDSIYAYLDDDAMEALLHAAKAAGVLGALATADTVLCSLARSRMPLCLQITNAEEASLLLQSQASGKRPFSGCRGLCLLASGYGNCLMAASVLSTAQRWPALEQLRLRLEMGDDRVSGLSPDHCMSGALAVVPALQRLRRLVLELPKLGTCCGRQLGQMQQLTSMEVYVRSSAGPAADLSALAYMSNLVDLLLYDPPAVQPAAGGGSSLPSSLTSLRVKGYAPAADHASWFSHLAGCPNLQHIELGYDERHEHCSSYPQALVQQLAQTNRQLRTLKLLTSAWCADLKTEVPQEEWQADAHLAALKGLEELEAGGMLCIRDQGDWQHLAQLTALKKLSAFHVFCAPAGGCALAALHSLGATIHVGGHSVGRLLQACPQLRLAQFMVCEPPHPTPMPAAAPLVPYPCLQKLSLEICRGCGAATAAAFWGAVVPGLGSALELELEEWPCGSSSYAGSSLPNLAPCTALTSIVFSNRGGVCNAPVPAQQEDFLSMLAPVVNLQRLHVWHAPQLNARAVLVLQGMLPLLHEVELIGCGHLLTAAAGGPLVSPEAEQQVLAKVKQLLRPGLELICL